MYRLIIEADGFRLRDTDAAGSEGSKGGITMKRKQIVPVVLSCIMLSGCGAMQQTAATATTPVTKEERTAETTPVAGTSSDSTGEAVAAPADSSVKTTAGSGSAVETLEDNTDLTIQAGGTYVLQGSAKNATVIVDASDTDRVELVLDGVSITNDDFPCIYVKNADKVTVSSAAGSENTLSVTGAFRADGSTNTDAAIFSRDDLIFDGEGSMTIASSDNGVTGKDDIVIAGGTLDIDCTSDALEVNNSIEIQDGHITIVTKKDGIHAEKSDDDTLGSILIAGGTLDITAADDAVHGTTTVRIDGGELKLEGAEAIEGTVIEIGGGTIDIAASDDGINASAKSTAASPSFTMNEGTLTIVMGAGDTDAIDSNGDLYINGGTIDITAQSPFDYVGRGEMTGGTVTVNGQQVTSLTGQMMGGRGGFRQGTDSGMQGGFPGRDGTMSSGDGTFPGGDGTMPPDDGQFPGMNGERPGRGGGRGGRGGFPGAGTGSSEATDGGF